MTIMENSRTYHINNSTVKLIFGDILTSTTDVLVISGSVGVPMIGGLPELTLSTGGECILTDAAKHSDAKLGDVVVTTAGNLPHKYIFQAVTVTNWTEVRPHLQSSNVIEIYEYIVGHAIAKSMRLLSAMELNSIALPCLGLGMGNMPLDAVAKITAETICRFLSRTNKSIEVEIYILDSYNIYSKLNYLPFFEWFAVYANMHVNNQDSKNLDPDTHTDIFKDVILPDITKPGLHKHTIFISYSRKDTEQARGVCDMLNKAGISYWIDINGVYSGANFKEEIVKAINSADIVLFLSSEASNNSSNVAKEISIADKYGKIIIPARLDDSPMNPKIDYDLAGIDFVDLLTFDEKNLARLKNAILAHVAMKSAS